MGIVYKAGKLLYHAGKLLMDCCVGACCVDGTCSQKSQCECEGTFQGVDSACEPNPCAECAVDGDCPEGQYCCNGTCQSTPCEAGRCCTVEIHLPCYSAGGSECTESDVCPDGYAPVDGAPGKCVKYVPVESCDECLCGGPEGTVNAPCGQHPDDVAYCTEEPCPASGGACCLPDGTCQDGLTQAECKECPTLGYLCEEWYGLLRHIDENGNPVADEECPDGYVPQGADLYCVKSSYVTSCEECGSDFLVTPSAGETLRGCPFPDDPIQILNGQPYEGTPPCGTWHAGKTCAENPCDVCSGPCGTTRCFEWSVVVSGSGFSTQTVQSSQSSGHCLCDDVYELLGDVTYSSDATIYRTVSGSLYLQCVDGQCVVTGGFCVELWSAADDSYICGVCYEAASGTITSLPYTVTFTQSSNDCTGGSPSVSITKCIFNGPLGACGEGALLEDPATVCDPGCECVDGECAQVNACYWTLTLNCDGHDPLSVGKWSAPGQCTANCAGLGTSDISSELWDESDGVRTYCTLSGSIEGDDPLYIYGYATFSRYAIAEDGSDGEYLGSCDISFQNCPGCEWDGITVPFSATASGGEESPCSGCSLTFDVGCGNPFV